MREKFGCSLLLWLILHGCCLCRFVVEKNNLKISSPESLRNVYECAIGNFGVPQYGGTMIGTVMYPTINQKACQPFNDSDLQFRLKAGGLPIFLLVNRGECFFTLKAWNVQNFGAAAILVADDRVEPLITMDAPEEQDEQPEYLQNITVPSALISKTLGDNIKKALSTGQMVNINLDWREALPHPDECVEYEFWTNSNDECGTKCDRQINFVRNFKGIAQILEKKGYTQFTPHYITWFCPEEFILSKQCTSQCINNGRYCAPDPDHDFNRGYNGKDVVVQNLRQACFFKVANESGRPWLWWDYVTDFSIRCPMKEKKYNKNCADQVIKSLGMDVKRIDKCIGDTKADVHNPVLKAEQEAQIGKGSRGDVTILPTIIINNRQYRGTKVGKLREQYEDGKMSKEAVLNAICSGFEETTEPAVCLSSAIQTNECLHNNGGCWHDKSANLTACKDSFRGRVCQCPFVKGVQFLGDGYIFCEGTGALRCGVNNGGCWNESRNGKTYSACIDEFSRGCTCPRGFRGDGVKTCVDINECAERVACQCPQCKCKNTFGSFECSCNDNLLYMQEHDTCIVEYAKTGNGWGVIWVIILGLTAAGFGTYAIYKYRIRNYMDAEIRAIMSQYMPLDNEGEVLNHQGQQNV